MKRIFACVLLLGLLVVNAAAAEGRYLHVVGAEEWISLREKPSASSMRIAQIPVGAMVWETDATSETENGFLSVNYGGKRGYVLEEYVRGTEAFSDMDAVPMYVTNCKEYVTLRQYPDTSAAEKARIPLGENVQVKSIVDEKFSYVWYNGKDGYVRSDYLSFLPSWGNIIRGAEMHVPSKNGQDFVQTVNGKAAEKLNELIRSATPGEIGKCPTGAHLRLVLEDGTPDGYILKLTMPLDGRVTLIAENEAVYELPEKCSEPFWAIFDKAWSCIG